MKSVFAQALECVVGAVDVVSDGEWATLHRTPAAGRARIQDPVLDLVSAMPSGVRLELMTDAAIIELDVHLTRIISDVFATRTAFDVTVDGELGQPVVVTDEILLRFDPAVGQLQDESSSSGTTVRFQLPPSSGERRVEIWLPNSSRLKLRDVRVPSEATLRPAPALGASWVHHGSSISQCAEADRPTATWPALVARTTGRSLINLGLGAQCQLDQFMAQTIRDTDAALISLELGINIYGGDTMRERTFVSAVHGFLDTIRQGHPLTPVLIVTPIFCPEGEHHYGPSLLGANGTMTTADRPRELAVGALTITRIRELLDNAVKCRRSEGDRNLHLVNGLTLFGEADARDLPDGLHPNSAGYGRIAQRFLEQLDRLVAVPQ